MMAMRTALLTTFLLALVAGAAAGCSQQRDPIDRVQSGALPKSFFLGERLRDAADDPEFYYRATIIDVPYGATGATGSGLSLFTSDAAPVSRIKWEVTQDTLTARLSFERIGGTDAKGGTTAGREGQIVAAFRILSHFDIRRAYNPSTGEELNVVEENTADRPYYDREYMRVDWSKNLVSDAYDFDTLASASATSPVKYDSLSYYVDDPLHPDAPQVAADYLDITQRVLATPQMIATPPELMAYGLGAQIPSCYLDPNSSLGTAPAGNCNPTEIKVRLAFRKLAGSDYEPAAWDGLRFQAYGGFTTDRQGYARNYGLTDDDHVRYLERYDLWKGSHAFAPNGDAVACGTGSTTSVSLDAHRDADGDGTEDECQIITGQARSDGGRFSAGARCDTATHRCTLPYRDRELRTIAWYFVGNGTDAEMFEPTEQATAEWDLALRAAAQVARLVECRKTGGDEAACRAAHPMWTGQQEDNEDAMVVHRAVTSCRRSKGWSDASCDAMADDLASRVKVDAPAEAAAIAAIVKMPSVLVLCHSPVAAGDHPSCGEKGLAPRAGDIRYHQVIVQNAPQTPSPWGVMTNGTDPLTGEVVAGRATIWNAVTDSAAQGTIDIVRYIAGELRTQDITDGTYVADWVRANQGAPAGLATPPMKKDQVIARVAAAAKADPARVRAAFDARLAGQKTAGSAQAEALARKGMAGVRATASPAAATRSVAVESRMARARGSALEAALVNGPMLQLAGVGPNAGTTPAATLDRASPLRGANPELSARLSQMRDLALAERGTCVVPGEMPELSGIVGLANALLAKFPFVDGEDPASKASQLARAERMRKYLARRYQYAVIAHEMGHGVGLRHNFVGSYHSFFFRPQYWQARTRNGTVTAACDDAVSIEDAKGCVGPRYFDPVTPEETDNMLWMWQQSSVMDYPGDVTVDTLGLGSYDFAAVRSFYADSVAVYSNRFRSGEEKTKDVLDLLDSFGGITGVRIGDQHYSQAQKNYGLIDPGSCVAYDPALNRPPQWDDAKEGLFHPVLDGHVVAIDGNYSKCRTHAVDYVAWTSLRSASAADVAAGSPSVSARQGPAFDGAGRLRVPYPFATDHWADTGNASVFRHDQGADPYEQFLFYITSSENRHIFDHYRRGRATFAYRPAASRDYERYTRKMMNTAKGLGLYAGFYRQIAEQNQYPFPELWADASGGFLADNVLAASIAMDHFTRQLTRPQPGPHYEMASDKNDPVLRSGDDFYGPEKDSQKKHLVTVPDGTSGILSANGFVDVSLGGAPVNNALDDSKGDYATQYPLNLGSYYQKINAIMALTESADNFISQSRGDFVDARYRATSMADVFPDGFRRLVANVLTGDSELYAPRVAILDEAGASMVDPSTKGPLAPIGWRSFWPAEAPTTCWSRQGTLRCGGTTDAPSPTVSRALDPQIGWEVQKYVIAWTYLYLPENQTTAWFDMLRVYRSSDGSDPDILGEKIVFRDPFTGTRYFARGFGTETIDGKKVQRGIAARVLEYANYLAALSYENGGVDAATGEVKYTLDKAGAPVVKKDPTIPGAFANDCDYNHYCGALKSYKSVPDFLHQAGVAYGLTEGDSPRGLY